MSIKELLTEIKTIYTNLQLFLEKEENLEENLQNFQKIINEVKIEDDKHQLKIVLNILSKISNSHYRSSNFISKIEKILQLFKESLSKNFTNSEIFNIFKNNKRILLFRIYCISNRK